MRITMMDYIRFSKRGTGYEMVEWIRTLLDIWDLPTTLEVNN